MGKEKVDGLEHLREPGWAALLEEVKAATGRVSGEEVKSMIHGLCDALRNVVAVEVNGLLEGYMSGNEFDDADVDYAISVKQERAKNINELCRKRGFAIKHPDTGEPCWLVAINDKWGGKYALEHIKTKKRSRTSREIQALLPLELMPIPLDPQFCISAQI